MRWVREGIVGRKNKQEKIEHVHIWKDSYNPSEKVCACGLILVAEKELLRREKEWIDYFKKVRETHAFKRFQQQRITFLLGDIGFVKGAALQAKKDLEKKVPNEIEKLHFPDPSTWNKYETQEKDIVEMAKEIFNE